MRRTFVILAAVATVAACIPPRAGGTVPPEVPPLRLGAAYANVPGDTVYVPIFWTPSAITDGYGPINGYATSAIRSTPSPVRDTTAHGWTSHGASIRGDTLAIPMPVRLINGQIATGKVCVRAVRGGVNSTGKCPGWSFTFIIPAPPPVDSAWTGPPATLVAFGYAPRWPRNPHMDEPVILGVAFPIPDSAGAVADASGFCVARLTSAGRLVTRPPGTDWDARYRRYCEEYAARFWPGRTVVAYESATSAERAELAEYRCVHFLVECGDVSRCRKPGTVGCDSLGWRVVPSLDPRAFRVIGLVPRSA